MNNSEIKFQEYLNNQRIPFWFIQQDVPTYSNMLRSLNIKRPDFFVLIPNFGFVLVDIKDKEPLKKHKKLCLDFDEVKKYANLQRLFNIPVWFVISNASVHYTTWYCLPASRAIMLDEFRFGSYMSIPLEEYIQISFDRSFYDLFKLSYK